MNYVMYEYNLGISYFSGCTIGTYRCKLSSKPVALRSLIKQLCWVGAVLMATKPYNNIGDGSMTSLINDMFNMSKR